MVPSICRRAAIAGLAVLAAAAAIASPARHSLAQPWRPSSMVATTGDRADELFALAAGHYERGEWAEAADGFHQFAQSMADDPRVGAAWFFAGEALLHSGDTRSARAAYQHYLLRRSPPELTEKATFRIAEIAARQREPDAVRLLESFLSAWPQSEWREFSLYYLGHLRLARREPQLARRVLDHALAEFPQSSLRAENLLGAGMACRMTGDLDAAAGYFAQLAAESSGPIRLGAQLNLASIAVLRNDHAAAAPLLAELLATPDLPEPLVAESWLLHGICLIEQGDPVSAATALTQAVASAIESDISAIATWQLARALGLCDRQAESEQQLEVLISEWPDHRLAPDAAIALIESATRDGRWQLAIDRAARLAHLWEPTAAALRVRELVGRSWYELKRYAECESTFEELLVRNPGAPAADRSRWLYFAGACQIGLQAWPAAAETLEQIDLAAVPAELLPGCLLARGTALVHSGRPDLAVPVLRELVAMPGEHTQTAQASGLLVAALAASKDWKGLDSAIGKLPPAAADSPESTQAVWRAGEIALAAGQTELARRCCKWTAEAAGTSNATRAESIAALGWIALQGGDDATALTHFERLGRDFSDTPAAARSWIAQAAIHERREAWETASWLYGVAAQSAESTSARHVALFKQAVALRKSGDPWSITRGGNILRQLEEEQTTAISRDQLQYELAWFEAHRGDESASLAKFEEIVSSAPDSPLWPDAALRTARRQIAAGETETAAGVLQQIIARNGVPAEILQRSHFLLGQLAAGRRDWQATDRHMQATLQLQPPRELEQRCRYWLAESAFRQEQYAPALAGFTALAESDSGFDADLVPWLYLRQSQCLVALRQYREAVRVAAASAPKFPQFSSVWEFDWVAGRALFAAGQFDDAIKAFERVTAARAARGSETAAQAQWMIGEALLHQEKYQAAIAAYYRVDSLYRSPTWRSAAILQAAKCHEKLGNRQQAVSLYEQLVQKFPDSQYAPDASRRLAALTKKQTAGQTRPNNPAASPTRPRVRPAATPTTGGR